MTNERPSPTIEDYLGVIYTLDRNGDRVISARLAQSLDVLHLPLRRRSKGCSEMAG